MTPYKRKPDRTLPKIKGWAPLEIAEQTLFPGIHPHQLTAAQRKQALAYAKDLLAERTGHRLEP